MPYLGMPRKAPVIQLDRAERTTLEEWLRSRGLAQEMALRVAIVLLAAQGLPNQAIGQQLGCSQPTVILWRGRFARDRLEGLRTRPRPGRPRRYEEARVNVIVAATLKKPEGATHWSTRRLAVQMGVSSATVQRIWRAHGLQPHRRKTFKYSRDPRLVEKVVDIVGLYLHPPEKALVLAVDEKRQIQALQRTAPLLPLGPGQIERHTHDYQRHGTVDLYAALQVASGQVYARFSPRHRHQAFLQFLGLLHITLPAAQQVHLILDNLATPKHPRVARWRKPHPRFHFHFTPTSASWMNQIEIWFGLLQQQRLARGNFHSVEELMHAITEFLNRWNDNAQPFIWAKTAEQILAKAIPKAISETGH